MKRDLPDLDALWNTLPSRRRYEITVTAQFGDLDDLNHVNNTVYLAWCEQVARAHALSLGMGTEALLALGAVPVARQHVITYHRPALLGDRIRVRTALTQHVGVRSVRAYALDRVPEDGRDGERVAECQTEWVWVDPTTGRPKRTPQAVLEAFGF
ncbi:MULTISPECIES: acyl-CoA thioesterase [Deinococcus]|uniref:Thioesterase superfamily n=1 Tax=Deinococcus geothermalis (strain DSM 11300 / CIP 105573 / AG-3a) TaxID=319795 RepID=Q1IY54_DEIGD|nr:MULTISPECIES: thioesterase family protein [Deinococcus]ABF45830.1 thioesterase superfamily [Deinococcus geothermalis DSM 11300]MBI0446086.1 acyl-CoA thioesterase [Deinococcus sp. DB0503]TDE85379.1 acyl-CoA thioesterase [Deinococcus sp. S9]